MTVRKETTVLKILNKISDVVNEACKAVCAVMMAYLFIVCTLQVIFRRFLNNSLSWSEETMRYVFVWMILLATATTVKEGSGAAIDLLKKKLRSEKALAVQEFIIFALTGVTAFALMKFGVTYALSATKMTSAAVHIPMHIVYAAIPAGSLFTLLHCVNGVADGIAVLCGRKARLTDAAPEEGSVK